MWRRRRSIGSVNVLALLNVQTRLTYCLCFGRRSADCGAVRLNIEHAPEPGLSVFPYLELVFDMNPFVHNDLAARWRGRNRGQSLAAAYRAGPARERRPVDFFLKF